MIKKILACCLLGCSVVAQAQELYKIPANTQSRVSSMENPGGKKGQGGIANEKAKGSAFTDLKINETKTLLVTCGVCIVQRIWVTLDNRSPEMLRGLRLRMYWDGRAEPAVDV